MSSSSPQEPRTHGRTRLSFAKESDIDEFVKVLGQYENGEITPDQWRLFRLLRGTYGQRQTDDVHMLRIKLPQGIVSSAQWNAMADIGERYSRRFGHITTRQNIQFHFVKLHDAEPAMRLLAEAGITTREACGNSVRNITCCPFAGVAVDEVFDVTPYSEALTRFLLRHKHSSSLPRKFKIAFEGCPQDHTAIAINDLAFHARVEGGVRGFRVMAGGGTAIMCKTAGVLHEFLPASEMFRVAESLLMVFKEHGDYIHKQRNRMKFMIKKLTWDGFASEYERALAYCRGEGGVAELQIDPAVEHAPTWARTEAQAPDVIAGRVSAAPPRGEGVTPVLLPVLTASDEAYVRWQETNVRRQRQDGFVQVVVTVPLGDLTSEQMRVVGELSDAFGDGTSRVTVDQDVALR
ncbi:MAG: nitrite/sulfite reductase, partial [Vicinamibacterales bacterium]